MFFLISRLVDPDGIERLLVMRPDDHGIVGYRVPLIDANYEPFWTLRVTWMIEPICKNAGESAALLNGRTP